MVLHLMHRRNYNMYKIYNNTETNEPLAIIRLSDGAFIPLDNSNTDYRYYLEWVAAGNVADPADTENIE